MKTALSSVSVATEMPPVKAAFAKLNSPAFSIPFSTAGPDLNGPPAEAFTLHRKNLSVAFPMKLQRYTPGHVQEILRVVRILRIFCHKTATKKKLKEILVRPFN